MKRLISFLFLNKIQGSLFYIGPPLTSTKDSLPIKSAFNSARSNLQQQREFKTSLLIFECKHNNFYIVLTSLHIGCCLEIIIYFHLQIFEWRDHPIFIWAKYFFLWNLYQNSGIWCFSPHFLKSAYYMLDCSISYIISQKKH